ncbi:MAG: D-glycero-alpha-D-manno-heptose-1,7-bisphosphate 7-phosphatase [Elusimicrobiales bacterium]
MRAWPRTLKKAPAAPTAFLDRDGTLNRNRTGVYVTAPEQLILYASAARAVKLLSEKGYRIVVLTNQSAVGRGYMTLAESKAINLKLVRDLRAAGAPVAAVYFCPHAPDAACACRKPRPGLLLEAAKDLPADPERSFVAGDKPSDLALARNAGLKGYLVLTGEGRAAGAEGYKDLLALARAVPDFSKNNKGKD